MCFFFRNFPGEATHQTSREKFILFHSLSRSLIFIHYANDVFGWASGIWFGCLRLLLLLCYAGCGLHFMRSRKILAALLAYYSLLLCYIFFAPFFLYCSSSKENLTHSHYIYCRISLFLILMCVRRTSTTTFRLSASD